MLKTRALVIITGLLGAATAEAQVTPVVTAEMLQANITRFSLEDIEDEDQVAVQLRWSATHSAFDAYEAELTYTSARTEENPTQDVVIFEEVETADESFIDSSVSGRTYTVYVLPKNILPASAVPERGGTGEDDGTINIIVRVGRAGDLTTLNNATDTWTFTYDTLAPAIPTITSTVPGEDRVQVSWRAPSERSDDVFSYEIVYCPAVSTTMPVTRTSTLAELPCPEDERLTQTSGETVTSVFIEDELVNGVPVAVAVRAIDDFGNVGELSDAWIAVPKDVTDFYELYRQEGGNEDGGFCFVATAAYGSYGHPVVRILRSFRDTVLKSAPFGQTLVWGYYQASPPLAQALAQRPTLALVARGLLSLVALIAALAMMAPFILLAAWGLRRVRGRGAAAVGATLLAIALSAPGGAFAERPKSVLDNVGLALEFKGGPFLPSMGNAENTNNAFGRLFGTNPGAMFKLGGELQLYRGFGTVSVGGSIGYQRFSGQGLFNEDGVITGSVSEDKTRLFLLPMSLVGVYRFDYFADHTWMPLVPYIKGGFAYTVWWSTNGRGNISRIEGAGPDGGDLIARGAKFGLTGALGISFLLNALEPRSATSLYSATSIRGTYFFAEVEATKADSFSDDGFDLSDLTWNLGLMLEF